MRRVISDSHEPYERCLNTVCLSLWFSYTFYLMNWTNYSSASIVTSCSLRNRYCSSIVVCRCAWRFTGLTSCYSLYLSSTRSGDKQAPVSGVHTSSSCLLFKAQEALSLRWNKVMALHPEANRDGKHTSSPLKGQEVVNCPLVLSCSPPVWCYIQSLKCREVQTKVVQNISPGYFHTKHKPKQQLCVLSISKNSCFQFVNENIYSVTQAAGT